MESGVAWVSGCDERRRRDERRKRDRRAAKARKSKIILENTPHIFSGPKNNALNREYATLESTLTFGMAESLEVPMRKVPAWARYESA